MKSTSLCLFALILMGVGAASDVPFVFVEGQSDVSDLSPDQLEQAGINSDDLAGVPALSSPSDDEILDFQVTGGGNIPSDSTEKRVGDLKAEFDARVEPDNPRVNDEAVVLALKYPGDLTIDQITSIYSYLKNGDNQRKGWGYVRDPRGIDYLRYANASLKLGDRADCVGGGDCDDFAILMAALVESIGGTTRIILARNNSIGGHAYTEVYLGSLSRKDGQVEGIISWLKQEFETDKIYTHIDTDTKDVWLNLDWGPDEITGNVHPGGPFFQGDKHIVLCIRDSYEMTPLKLPDYYPLPAAVPLIPSYATENVTMNVTEEVHATENVTANETTENDAGDNQIEVRVRDGKHAGPEKYDVSKEESFTLDAPKPMPTVVADAENLPPVLESLSADKDSPQESSASVTWTSEAKDPEGDQVLYRFFLNGWPVTGWSTNNLWTTCAWGVSDTTVCENRTAPDVGENQIEVRIRDGKHADIDGFDDRKIGTFVILPSNQRPVIINFIPDKLSPQEIGSTITWTADAIDAESDPLSFMFLLNGQPVTAWQPMSQWSWATNDADVGVSQVAVRVKDDNHAIKDGFDDSESADFTISLPTALSDVGGSDSGIEPVPSTNASGDNGIVDDIKGSFESRVEPENSRVHEGAIVLALKFPGEYTINQIDSIYNYLKDGGDSIRGWQYVRDPRGVDYYNYANESLELGSKTGSTGAGDCDDFAILISSIIEAIGGTTRIVLVENNSMGGHAYAEVYLGQLHAQGNQVEEIINWLKQKYNTDKIYTHIDPETQEVWLNLYWGADETGSSYPGGPFFLADKHMIIYTRDQFEKTPLKLDLQ